jgi:signal peptidase I
VSAEPPTAAQPVFGGPVPPDPPPVTDSYTFQPSATTEAELPPASPPVTDLPRIVGPDPMLEEPWPASDGAAAAAYSNAVPDQARVDDAVMADIPTPDAALVDAVAIPPQPPAAPAEDTAPRGWSISFARVGEELLAWFKTLLSAAVYATLIVTFGFQVARVEGQSMVPTLEDQDRLIVNKLAYRLGEPRVGDIVMLYYPEDPSKSFVKRIVAEPGDTIKIVDGRVLRNEVPLADDFIPEKYRDHDNLGPFVLPRGYYYVMGDHRNNSSDSRTWGYVPKRYIIGKVQLRWWPVNSAKVF